MMEDTSDSFNSTHPDDKETRRLEASARFLGRQRAQRYNEEQAVLIQAEYARLLIDAGYEEDEANEIAERKTTLNPDPLTLDESEELSREEKKLRSSLLFLATSKVLKETADVEMDRDRGWDLDR